MRRLAAIALGVLALALATGPRVFAQGGIPDPRAHELVPAEGVLEGGTRMSPDGTRDGAADTPMLRPTPTSQAGPVDPVTYRVGPGDVLQLDLWGRLAKSVMLEVSPEGKLFLSGSGSIDVAGSTLAETRRRILDLVNRTFRDVHADLRLVRLRTIKVYASGSVVKSGAFEVTAADRASEVVARAQLQKHASRRNIVVRHRDGSESRLDLAWFEATGRGDRNPYLLDGDVLLVPDQSTLLGAYGAMMRPGEHDWASGDSLSTLLAIAGGLLPSAARDHLLLVRFEGASHRDSMWLDGARVADGTLDLPLQDGDRIYAHFTSDWHQLPTVGIYGEVSRPGAYPIMVGRDRLSDLLAWAGGTTPRANRSAVHLVRDGDGPPEADPEFDRLARLSRNEMTESEYTSFQTRLAERRNSFRVDLDRMKHEGPEVDPLLRDQDVVRVEPMVWSVRVEGQVGRPGLIDFQPGRGLAEYVRLAGGFTDRASRGNVRVSRSLTGQVIPVKSGQSIQPGDFIWVPERRDIDAWGIFRDVVAVAGQVAVIIVATRQH